MPIFFFADLPPINICQILGHAVVSHAECLNHPGIVHRRVRLAPLYLKLGYVLPKTPERQPHELMSAYAVRNAST
jgi:hypothetical protein